MPGIQKGIQTDWKGHPCSLSFLMWLQNFSFKNNFSKPKIKIIFIETEGTRVGCPPDALLERRMPCVFAFILIVKTKKYFFWNYFFTKQKFFSRGVLNGCPPDALPCSPCSLSLLLWKRKNIFGSARKINFLSSSIERMPSGCPPCSLSFLLWKRKIISADALLVLLEVTASKITKKIALGPASYHCKSLPSRNSVYVRFPETKIRALVELSYCARVGWALWYQEPREIFVTEIIKNHTPRDTSVLDDQSEFPDAPGHF